MSSQESTQAAPGARLRIVSHSSRSVFYGWDGYGAWVHCTIADEREARQVRDRLNYERAVEYTVPTR